MDQSLRIRLSEEGADDERLDTLTRYLRQELLELDVTDVKPMPGGESPAGTRAFDVMEVGGLIVSLVSSDALRAVVATIRSWLSRGHQTTHSVKMEIDGDVLELSAATTAEQRRLIDAFVARHSAEDRDTRKDRDTPKDGDTPTDGDTPKDGDTPTDSESRTDQAWAANERP